MSTDLICRTKTFNDTHPCFIDDRGDCIVVTTRECGLDLEGIPENEQTREYLDAARKTGLSTILSFEDAVEVTNRKVPIDYDHFRPAQEAREIRVNQAAQRFMIDYDHFRPAQGIRVNQAAQRFMADAQLVLQKIRTRTKKPLEKPRKRRGCNGAPFGTNMLCDKINFDVTVYDLDSHGRLLPDTRGRRKGEFGYLRP